VEVTRATLHPLIYGARSSIGTPLLADLCARGAAVRAVSRQSVSNQLTTGGLRWTQAALPHAPALTGDITHLISLGPGDRFLDWLRQQSPQPALRQIIALGSTSADTKIASSSSAERDLAQHLRAVQHGIAREAKRLGVPWTLLRPTLIYGGADDSVARIGRWIVRRRVYPWLLGSGAHTRRQPVHAHDLARAVDLCMDCERSFDSTFDLPGGETLSFRDFICRIASASGRIAMPIPIPLGPALHALGRLSLLAPSAALDASAATRVQRDQVFDASAARLAFGYAPRAFAPDASTW